MKRLTFPFLFFCFIASTSAADIEFEADHSLPLVYLNVIVNAGSANDPANKLGLATLASQMLLRGTQKNSKSDFFQKLDEIGGSITTEVRAEGVIYKGAVLSENLTAFLDLFEETLVKPKFTAEELQKLKKEIEGQILQNKSEDRPLALYHFYRFFYGNHGYGNPELGTQHSIKTITNGDIIDFYSRYFGAKTITVMGSGAADKSAIEDWVQKVTEKLSALHPEAEAPAPFTKPVIPEGRRALISNKPTTQTQILMGATGMRPEDPGFYAVQLANYTFGGPSFNARLMTEIRVKRGWTYGASNTFRFGKQPRHFAMHMFPKTADTVPAIGLTIKLFEDFVKNGITDEEFTFARDSLVNNSPFNFDTPKKRIDNATTEYLTSFPKGYFRNFADNIDRVSKSDVAPALKSFFKPANLTLLVLGDASKLREPISRLPGFSKPVVKNYLEE